MKVILTAFNGLMHSDVLNWPEVNTTDDKIQFSLRQLDYSFFKPDKPDERTIVDLRATFRPTGGVTTAKNGELIIWYELVHVTPQHWENRNA